MIKLGITGQVGTGKSTVAGLFGTYGAKMIDSDKIAHRLIKPKTRCWRKIAKAFGVKVLNKNSQINRKILGQIIFKSTRRRKILNAILHPEVVKEIKKQLKKMEKDDIVAIEIPLLVEAGLFNLADKIIVVKCSEKQQLERLARCGIKKYDAEKMIKSQFPLRKKIKYADYVIDNSRSISHTRCEVKKIFDIYTASFEKKHG